MSQAADSNEKKNKKEGKKMKSRIGLYHFDTEMTPEEQYQNSMSSSLNNSQSK